MQVQGNNSNNVSSQVPPRLERKPGGKVPTGSEVGLSQESFNAVNFSTKKDESALLRQAAAKGGRLVDINGEKRIQVGNDWFRPYVGRKGYDENFLGEPLGMPTLDPSIRDKAAPRIDDPSRNELEYTNFSIVMNKERRMPFFTAVNIDGSQVKEVERGDKWLFDPRVAREHQLGNEAYKNNDIDRGHMVRRRDAVWGGEAGQASTDTFVYTNAAPQHKDLNQHEWLDLENRVFDKAQAEGKRMTVFTGPVFHDSDPSCDNGGRMDTPTKIPQDFWKVVVWKDPEKGLQSEAFVMTQKHDLEGNSGPKLELKDESDFSLYRVPLSQLEEMTKLDFGKLNNDCTSCQRL